MNKKTLLILCLVLVAVIAAAAVLYNSLGDQVQLGGLATQPTEPSQSTEATQGTQATDAATEAPDYSAPDFTVYDWDGNPVKLSDYEGKPTVLNFWASWCGPCKSEMPDFQTAFETYGEEINFLMVNCTGGRETEESARAFIEDHGYTFPVFFDTTYEAASTYGASSIPMTFFIDKNGDLVTYGMGALSADLLAKGIGMIYEG